ncbi:uncharacterized protein ZBAI_02548 [Zygosaccharomyces bailii ISA1307]|nr:uncharacterized protein ZBAI_02548 [Zygosaccharomyces bailii ISA1307]
MWLLTQFQEPVILPNEPPYNIRRLQSTQTVYQLNRAASGSSQKDLNYLKNFERDPPTRMTHYAKRIDSKLNRSTFWNHTMIIHYTEDICLCQNRRTISLAELGQVG